MSLFSSYELVFIGGREREVQFKLEFSNSTFNEIKHQEISMKIFIYKTFTFTQIKPLSSTFHG